jgi:hypothetical protein
MFGPNRRKTLSHSRLALMLLIAFGMLAQSVLDLSGQTHDAVLHPDAGVTYTSHVDHDHELEHVAPGEDGADRDPAATLHLLMHQTCGGHCIWIAGTAIARVPVEVLPTAMPPETTAPIPSSGLTAPFRPPIRA